MIPKEVGIWGSYNYGNFGDDLMAQLFANELINNGYTPVIFSKNKNVINCEKSKILDSVDSWNCVNGTIIMGGGAMLSSDSLVEYLLRPTSRAVDNEFKELYQTARKNSYKIIPISIGGDGLNNSVIYGWRNRFFKGDWASNGSVRLKGDISLLSKKYNKNYEYFPDVLFATEKVLNYQIQTKKNKSLKIGINLNKKKSEKLIKLLTQKYGNDALKSIVTHSSYYPRRYEWCDNSFSTLVYENMRDFIEELASLDIIISDKLHVGLVASVYGVPFLSYQGKNKTVGLHKELNLYDAICNTEEDALTAVDRIINVSGLSTLVNVIKEHQLDSQALGHFKLLNKLLIS